MNLEESNLYQQEIENSDKKKRLVMISIVLCAIFMIILFALIIVISYQDSITEKFFIDGRQTSAINNSIYTNIDGVTYVDVRTFSNALGYTYTKGEYKKYNENEDSCYLQNNFEIIALKADETSYNKYLEIAANATIADIKITSKNASGYSENYKLDNPIVFQNGKIYVPLTSLNKMFNINMDWQEFRKRIYTLENRVVAAQNVIAKHNYSEISGYYENIRAVIDGYVIVGNGNTGSKYYGIFSLKDNTEMVSLKYDEITYVQNVEEFYIKVGNGTMGILDSTGGTIIAPSEFEEISLLDGETQLYLVKKGKEYGVVNRNGKILVYAENDEIGLDESVDTTFTLESIKNKKLLFGKYIPVKKDGKYGLYNKDGEQVLNISYQGFGYKSTATSTTSGNEQSVLLIPASVGINGIVINKDDLYGVLDATTGKIIFPCVYNKIYAITRNGKTTYYADWNGGTIDIKEYLKEENLNNVSEDGKELSSTSEESDLKDGNTLSTGSEVRNEVDTNTVTNTVVVETN